MKSVSHAELKQECLAIDDWITKREHATRPDALTRISRFANELSDFVLDQREKQLTELRVSAKNSRINAV